MNAELLAFLSQEKTDTLLPLANQPESKSFFRTALLWKGSVTPRVIARIGVLTVYSMMATLVVTHFPQFAISMTPFEYSGTLLGIILVFRVNAGLDRWWEARKIWGSIVNQSRNLAIMVASYVPGATPTKKEMIRWIATWPHVMRLSLRGEKDVSFLEELIGANEVAGLRASQHLPTYVGFIIAGLLKKLRTEGLDDFAFQRAERERALLIDAIGACERIKNTPIPLVLAIKIRRFIFLFLLLLPVALAERIGWTAPFVVALASYPLFSLDEIGIELQDPFAKENLSHLPLTDICKNLEKNICALEGL